MLISFSMARGFQATPPTSNSRVGVDSRSRGQSNAILRYVYVNIGEERSGNFLVSTNHSKKSKLLYEEIESEVL